MAKDNDFKDLLEKVEKVTKEKKLDLSSGEDLSIGIMNLISAEEHLFFTYQKTGKESYLELLNEVRLLRTDLLKKIIQDYEGEVWCTSKHLLSASMRLIEVGTKELKKGNKKEAEEMFNKAHKLYSLFWGIASGVVKTDDIQRSDKNVSLISDKTNQVKSVSLLDKIEQIFQKALDCCRE